MLKRMRGCWQIEQAGLGSSFRTAWQTSVRNRERSDSRSKKCSSNGERFHSEGVNGWTINVRNWVIHRLGNRQVDKGDGGLSEIQGRQTTCKLY